MGQNGDTGWVGITSHGCCILGGQPFSSFVFLLSLLSLLADQI
jgi:hypothetical protein